jgi:hypothetical protein
MGSSYICQKAKTTVVLVVCCAQRPEIRWLPHMQIGNPTFRAPFGGRQVHTEDLRPCRFDLSVCVTWSGQKKKKFGKQKKKGKVDFNNKHGFKELIWALQFVMRLVNA